MGWKLLSLSIATDLKEDILEPVQKLKTPNYLVIILLLLIVECVGCSDDFDSDSSAPETIENDTYDTDDPPPNYIPLNDNACMIER